MANYNSAYTGAQIDAAVGSVTNGIEGTAIKSTGQDLGTVLTANGTGGTTFTLPVNLAYTTTTPTEANTNGLKIAVLSTDPATKYGGWIYIITA